MPLLTMIKRRVKIYLYVAKGVKMKRKEEIINYIKMFIPIILLSVSSYVLLYFMLSKDRYIIQSILCAFYYLYLIYFIRG